MKAYITRIVRKAARSQTGFTLAELLVVVGIVVGLAAVILPNVGRFTGEGARGALATELSSVQAAVDAWAVDQPATVPSVSGLAATNNFTSTGDIDLITSPAYLRLPNSATQTVGFYCWDSSGTVSQQALASPNCA